MSSIPPKSSTVAPSTPRGLEFVEDEIRDSFPTSYAQQEIRFRQDQIDRHNAWVERNAPPPMGDGEKRHFLRLLVISSALYHEERSSTTLTKKIASLVQAKQLEDPSLPRFNVDPDSPRLSAPLIRQMFNDVDYIMTNYKGGQSLASKALESLQLWRIDTQFKVDNVTPSPFSEDKVMDARNLKAKGGGLVLLIPLLHARWRIICDPNSTTISRESWQISIKGQDLFFLFLFCCCCCEPGALFVPYHDAVKKERKKDKLFIKRCNNNHHGASFFNDKGLAYPPGPADDGDRKALTLAFCASKAAYAGLKEADVCKVRSSALAKGDSVVFFQDVQTRSASSRDLSEEETQQETMRRAISQIEGNDSESPGSVEVEGVVMRLLPEAGMVEVRLSNGTSQILTVGALTKLDVASPNAAMAELERLQTCATGVMWSTGYHLAKPYEAGHPHPHLVIESNLFGWAVPTLVIACRGSVTADDWAADFSPSLAKRPSSDWESKVHGGFLARAESIPIEPFLEHLRNGGTLLFTGHSLGSAVAEILCAKVVRHILRDDHALRGALETNRVTFIGFASPVIGTAEFGKFFRTPKFGFGNIFHHFQTELDVVPTISNIAAFRHSSVCQPAAGGLTTLFDTALPILSEIIFPSQLVAVMKLVKPFASQSISQAIKEQVIGSPKLPELIKGFGRWYQLSDPERADPAKVSYLDNEQRVVQHLRDDVAKLANLNSKTLIEGLCQHRLDDYQIRLEKALVLSHPTDRVSCKPRWIFPVDQSNLRISDNAKHSGRKSTLRVEVCSVDKSSASMLINVRNAQLVIEGTEDRFESQFSSLPLQYISVRPAPYSVSLTFNVDEAKVKKVVDTGDAKVRLLLSSIYNLGESNPTTFLSDPISVQSNADDTHVVETLRGSLFVSLACMGTEASKISSFAQDAIRRLEKAACDRVQIGGFPDAPVVHLQDRETKVLLKANGIEMRVTFERVGDAYNVRNALDNLYLTCVEPKEANYTKVDAWGAKSAAAAVRLSIVGGGWRMTEEKTKSRLSGTWGMFGSGYFYWLHPDFPKSQFPTIELFHDDEPTLKISPALYGPLTQCAQILATRYVCMDVPTSETTIRRKMITDPQEFVTWVTEGDTDESARLKSAMEFEPSKFSVVWPGILNDNEEERNLLGVIDTIGCGQLISMPSTTVFEEWNRVAANRTGPPPPITRFFFLSLPLVFDVALTVVSTVKEDLVTKQVSWWEWMLKWNAKDVLTNLSTEYAQRVLLIASFLKGQEFDAIRSCIAAEQGKNSADAKGVAKVLSRYPPPVVERMLLDFDAAFRAKNPQLDRGGGSKWSVFKAHLEMKDIQACPNETIEKLYFVYRLIVGIAELNVRVHGRCHVAAAFGPQQTGKSTLLETLVRKSNPSGRDAKGHTKEPIILAARVVAKPGGRGVQDNGPEECHLICDLPGSSDGSKTGTEIRNLQLLILSWVRALIVLHSMDSQNRNQQRFDILAHVSRDTKVAVLFARSNTRFEQLKNVAAREGLAMTLYKAPEEPEAKVLLEWESVWYELEPTSLAGSENELGATIKVADLTLMFPAGRIVALRPRPPPSGTTDLTPIPHFPPRGLRIIEEGNAESAEKINAKRDAFSKLAKLAIKSEDEGWTAAVRTAWSADQSVQIAMDAAALDRLLEACPDPYVFGQRLQGEKERVCQMKDISYWRAQQLWDAVRAETEGEKRIIVSELGRWICNQNMSSSHMGTATSSSHNNSSAVPCQFYIPKFPEANYFATFSSQPSAQGTTFSVTVALGGNPRVFKELHKLIDAEVGEVPVVLRHSLGHRNPALLKVIGDAFEAASLKYILNQDDIRSFLAVAFGEVNKELLGTLGIKESSPK